jgi:hypothetical protein
MTSRMVVSHQKLSNEIATALQTHAPAIVEAVREVTRAESPKHEVDAGPLLAHVGRVAGAALTTLEGADSVYQLELGDDAEPRDRRDAAASELSNAIVGLKGTTRSLFGDAWVTKLTFPREVSSDPAHLKRAAEQVIGALEKYKLPKPQAIGVGAVDASAWKALLRTHLAALTAALDDVKREEKEAVAARAARDAALTALVNANVNAAQLAQVLARIGGVSHLVEGLRGTLDTSSSATENDEDPPVTDPTKPVTG